MVLTLKDGKVLLQLAQNAYHVAQLLKAWNYGISVSPRIRRRNDNTNNNHIYIYLGEARVEMGRGSSSLDNRSPT